MSLGLMPSRSRIDRSIVICPRSPTDVPDAYRMLGVCVTPRATATPHTWRSRVERSNTSRSATFPTTGRHVLPGDLALPANGGGRDQCRPTQDQVRLVADDPPIRERRERRLHDGRNRLWAFRGAPFNVLVRGRRH